MTLKLDRDSLAKAIKQKRIIELEESTRVVAKYIGCSAATVSRLERRSLPDVETYFNVCSWLGVQPSSFFVPSKTKNKPSKK
jgi:transcriptional regulator with XRE-family HTH domain